jgi:hypothetical protein
MAHNIATRKCWHTMNNTEFECNSQNIIASMLYGDYVLYNAYQFHILRYMTKQYTDCIRF